MKVDILDAHDRYQNLLKKQSDIVQQGIHDCIFKNKLSLELQDHSPYIYIFAHPRTDEDGNKIMMWQPRLLKPKAQTNSYLFRAKSKSDIVEICWIIPPRELFSQYKKGNVTESDIVEWSIDMFENHRKVLELPYEDDLPNEKVKYIYTVIASKKQLRPKILSFPEQKILAFLSHFDE